MNKGSILVGPEGNWQKDSGQALFICKSKYVLKINMGFRQVGWTLFTNSSYIDHRYFEVFLKGHPTKLKYRKENN